MKSMLRLLLTLLCLSAIVLGMKRAKKIAASRTGFKSVGFRTSPQKTSRHARRAHAEEKNQLGAAYFPNTFECTNGKNPALLTQSEYIDEFKKGPCSPTLVLAGIIGTKLNILIDCEELRSQHPDIFEVCGWRSCNSNVPSYLRRIFGVPHKEYSAWIPDVTSPFSLLDPRASAKQCFKRLLGLRHVKKGDQFYTESPKGVTVLPVGLTPETVFSSRCGFDAITNMLPVQLPFLPDKFNQYENLRIKLEAMGYKIGLTAQALPYDWRLSMHRNQVSHKMEGMLSSMKDITGKRVSIIAHSYGNVNTLNVLNQMPQSSKDRLVQRFFAVGPPFLGSPTSFFMLIGGVSKYYVARMGIDFATFKGTLATFPGVYDLMPRRTWSLYKDAPWMKSVLKRIAMEDNQSPVESLTPAEDIVDSIFPPVKEKCFLPGWNFRPETCVTGMKEFYHLGKIHGEEVTVENMDETLKKYSYDAHATELLKMDVRRNEYDRMENPGVQVTILYSTLGKSKSFYEYVLDPTAKSKIETAEFVEADRITEASGDDSVLTASSLVPGFKWAYENFKSIKNAKPVIFAEVCSTVNPRNSIFEIGTKQVLQNEYQSIACKCVVGNPGGCAHLGMVSDVGVVEYLANSLLDGQLAEDSKNYTEDDLSKIVKQCKLLNP